MPEEQKENTPKELKPTTISAPQPLSMDNKIPSFVKDEMLLAEWRTRFDGLMIELSNIKEVAVMQKAQGEEMLKLSTQIRDVLVALNTKMV